MQTVDKQQPGGRGMHALTQPEVEILLTKLDDWQQQGQHISKTYTFKNYYQTIAFVNALAWMTHQADHHPDLTVTYNSCSVSYSTHDVGGLSEKDFTCAAYADELFRL